MRCKHTDSAEMLDITETENKYYLSIKAKNEKGVIGRIGTVCAENNINLASIMQHGISDDNTADITVITEKVLEQDIKRTIEQLEHEHTTVVSLIRVYM